MYNNNEQPFKNRESLLIIKQGGGGGGGGSGFKENKKNLYEQLIFNMSNN